MYRNCAYRYVDSINWVVEIITGNVSIIITSVYRIFEIEIVRFVPSPPIRNFESKNFTADRDEAHPIGYVIPFLPSTRDKRRKGRNYTGEIARRGLKTHASDPIRIYFSIRISGYLALLQIDPLPWDSKFRVAGICSLLCPRGSRAATTGVSVKWRALHVNPDSFHGEEEINRRELRAN